MADSRPTAEEFEALVGALRREIADKDQLIQQYKDKLLDIVMGFDKVQEGEYSGFSKILKATEEQNRLLREVVERRDAEIDRLEANQAQNEGPPEDLMGKLNSIQEDVKAGIMGMRISEVHKNKINEKLLNAAGAGKVELVKEFLSQGAHIDGFSSSSDSPLCISAWKGHLPVVKVLIEKGAYIEARNVYNDTPLYLAALQGRTGTVQYLIDSGANVNATGYGSGKTPLGIAIEKKHHDAARALKKAGGKE